MTTTEREIVIGWKYKARKQFKRFHRRKQRWAILVCHRRAGKTVPTSVDLILSGRCSLRCRGLDMLSYSRSAIRRKTLRPMSRARWDETA